MSLQDLYQTASPDTVKNIPQTPTETKPDSSILYQAAEAINSPSIGNAWVGDKLDKLLDAPKYEPKQLELLYPDAPKGLFKSPNTERGAEYIYKREKQKQTLDMLSDYRKDQNTFIPDTVRDLGYGLLKETGPTELVAGAIIGAGIVAAAPAVGIGTIVEGSLVASNLQWAALGALEGGTVGTFNYLLQKQYEKRTQEKADPFQIPLGVGLGFGLGFAGGVLRNYFARGGPGVRSAFDSAADEHLRGNSRIEIPEDGITRIPKGDYQESWHAHTQVDGTASPKRIDGTTRLAIEGVHSPVGEVTLAGKLKYKTYSGAEYTPIDNKPNTIYSLFNKESAMTHNGAEEPFSGATYASKNTGDLRAYAASVKQGGDIVAIDTSNLKVANLGEADTLSSIRELLTHYHELFDSEMPSNLDAQGLMRFIAKQDTADIIHSDIMNSLKSRGYDALSYKTTEHLLGRTFNREHTFLFDGIADKQMSIVDRLDGSLAGLPESVTLNNEIASKAYNLQYSEGIMSNGKKITLDPYGYFNSDPFYNDEQFKLGMIHYFDKDHIDFINDMIADNNPEKLQTMVPQLQADTIEYLNQLDTYKGFLAKEVEQKAIDDSFKNVNAFGYLPEKDRMELYKTVEKSLENRKSLDELFVKMRDESTLEADNATQVELMQNQMRDVLRKDAIDKLVGKTVEQLDKEGKAFSILEKAKIEKDIASMVERAFNRVDTTKVDQVDQIISHYDAKIETLAKENPKLYPEILKAADFCLRRYLK